MTKRAILFKLLKIYLPNELPGLGLNKGQMCKLLVKNARTYVKRGIRKSLIRSMHMHTAHVVDEMWAESDQNLAFAVLIDFINYIAEQQGLDLAIYTKDLTAKRCKYARNIGE